MRKKADHGWLRQLQHAAWLRGRQAIFLRETASTNDEARKLAETGASTGAVVIAERQLQGRGRMGRKWQSKAGHALTFSYLYRPQIKDRDIPALTLVAGLAVARAIEACTGLETLIKWPNDILVTNRKVAGLLCEFYSGHFQGRLPAVIIGIGVNVSMAERDFSEEIRTKATSLLLAGAGEISLPTLFMAIINELELQLQCHQEEGFGKILEEWRRKDATYGRRLAWVDVKGGVVEGLSLGPDEKGVLHVRDDAGIIREVVSGDLTLIQSGAD